MSDLQMSLKLNISGYMQIYQALCDPVAMRNWDVLMWYQENTNKIKKKDLISDLMCCNE